MFLVYNKRKSDVFKFLRFDERFRQAPFSGRINMDGRNRASLSNFSGLVWTGSLRPI